MDALKRARSESITFKLTPKQLKAREDWIAFATSASSSALGIAYWGRIEVINDRRYVSEREKGGVRWEITPGRASDAWGIMAQALGCDWYGMRSDANTYDEAIQRAVFGKLVYG